MFYITVPPDGQLGGFELMVTPDSTMCPLRVLCKMFGSGITGSWGLCIPNFTKLFPIVLQIVCSCLLSHQQDHIFLILAFLVGVKWCDIAILIYIYLITSEFGHFCIFFLAIHLFNQKLLCLLCPRQQSRHQGEVSPVCFVLDLMSFGGLVYNSSSLSVLITLKSCGSTC